MTGLIGRKIGMTRVFHEETGHAVPVTVIQTGTNVVQQIKTMERDGYQAVQLGFDIVAENKLTRARAGHCKKHGSETTRIVREVKLDDAGEEVKPGQKLGVETLENVKYVDVIGVSKGRGFSGTIKRHNFQSGRKTHGNTNHREPGSTGESTYPARVFPGKKQSGQYGNSLVTVKGLEVVGVDKDMGLVYLKGAIPGRRTGVVFIRKNAIKKQGA
jgi:large subunit ribosomal protein L3